MNTFVTTFRSQLNSSIVKFQFVKKDKSIREAIGTTNIALIPENLRSNSLFFGGENMKVIPYFDLKSRSWKSMQIEADFIVLNTIPV